MQLKRLFDDDDAVSPVIGVILMVAITVILAAVIATFVLGLGEQVSQTTPTASFSSEYAEVTGSSGNLTFTHDGGDTIVATSLVARGQNGSSGSINANWTAFSNPNADAPYDSSSGSNSTETAGGQKAVSAGDFLRTRVASDAEVRLVFDASDSEQTSTLARFQGPDA